MSNIKNWLHYYRNSLFDSENLAIDTGRIKGLFHQQNNDLSSGLLSADNAAKLIDSEERRINKLRGISKKKSSNWHSINDTEIIIAPFELELLNSTQKKQTLHPFWLKARINRSGQLTPPKDFFPIITRNYLAPIADVKNDFIFSDIDLVEEAKEIVSPEPFKGEESVSWAAYWDYIELIFNQIAFGSIHTYRTDAYKTIHKITYFAKSSKIATAKSILFLYENLINETVDFPLVEKLVNLTERTRKEPIGDKDFLTYNHLHLGQMSNQFPLSISQRKTLLSYLTAESNAVTAVNGPPGTGKTTLLQSLVATEVVRAAIKGEDAPVIMACSTNNQAVTNIIDSFINAKSSLGLLSQRWLPNFNGYATYLPSNSKSEKKLENVNFLKGNLFGNEGTLCDMENENYIYDAEHNYFEKFYEYFGFDAPSLEDACKHIQEHITVIEDHLITGGQIATEYYDAIQHINTVLLKKELFIDAKKPQVLNLQKWRKLLVELKKKANDNDFSSKFSELFLEDNSYKSKEDSDCYFLAPPNAFKTKDTRLSFIKKIATELSSILSSLVRLKEWMAKNNIKGFPDVTEEAMWNGEYEKISSQDFTPRFFYDEIDMDLRHQSFLLAIHYWEARWLIATIEMLEEDLEKGTGELIVQKRWKRRAMLTPCFVATFYMAPSHFVYSQFQGESSEGNPIFEYLPLYNFIDLLIIDEGGQVTPEVSIPLFALAKKAIVVGDLKQIEPIWMIPPSIDKGNLKNQNITASQKENDLLKELGFLASSGSIMRMAQNACQFESIADKNQEKGLILLEHRRCNDEIIGFCNELAYGGILKPMKGTAKSSQLFPSMLAYHTEGFSEKLYNSRLNKAEVKAIITWLVQNKEAIEKAYEVSEIETVLGIITPFTSQKSELSKALTEAGFNVNKIKLGTVHALQGAERNIVLFSSVYTLEDEGTLFFDRDNKPNMLNVAVSRARDSFILFGDTRVFDENNKTPSGVLKKHLEIVDK